MPGLRTRLIFKRVQVRVQEIFASPSSSSSSKNFIFRVQVRVRQKKNEFSEFKFEFAALDFIGRNGMNK